MKTAVSINDETFERAERLAREHGLNRSQFYSAALVRYSDELESQGLTAAIDAAVDTVQQDDSSAFAARVGRRALASDDDAW